MPHPLSSLLLLLCLTTAAQEPAAEKVALSYLLGDWLSEDSLQVQISFIVEGNDVQLLDKDGAQPYLFSLENDSASVQGIIIHWPPYYCYLEPVDAQRIVIAYSSSVSDQVTRTVYMRK